MLDLVSLLVKKSCYCCKQNAVIVFIFIFDTLTLTLDMTNSDLDMTNSDLDMTNSDLEIQLTLTILHSIK